MTTLYLFSKLHKFTEKTFNDFLNSSNKSKKIAVLLQHKDMIVRVDHDIHELCNDNTDLNLSYVYPDEGSIEVPEEMLEHLSTASHILVWGGHMHIYQLIYTNPNIASVIIKKYQAGTPYAGLSAGAILAVNFGFIPNSVLKPHFSESSRFEELLKKMRKNKVKYGFALDDGIALKITDGTEFQVYGKGSFYLFNQLDTFDYNFKILKSGDKFSKDLTI